MFDRISTDLQDDNKKIDFTRFLTRNSIFSKKDVSRPKTGVLPQVFTTKNRKFQPRLSSCPHNFFFQSHKLKGSSLFFSGILLILIGWTIIGMVVEIYGFFVLFKGFFPAMISFAKRMPVVGSFLSTGPIGKWLEKYESPGMA